MADPLCRHCQTQNTLDALTCVNCGRLLDPEATQPSQEWTEGMRLRRGISVAHTVIFQIGTEQLSVVLKPGERLILGRLSAQMLARPDLDLERFRATENGISRIHAVLEAHDTGVMLADLGSRNGTYVGETRLLPFQPHSLSQGDEIQLGQLLIKVHLKTVNTSTQPLNGKRPRTGPLGLEMLLV
jgi:hypothetical protein